MDYDVVVIGSGAGGLAAAVALAQAGRKVLVLEQHYVPGGWCHSFQLGGYRFSPGVHYVGKLGGEGRLEEIYRGLGVSGDLEFCELNEDGFDHVLIDGERFDIPKGREVYADRLKARFPAEREGIDAYLKTVERMGRELDAMLELKGPLDVLALPWRAPTVARWGLFSAKSLINAHAKHPRLRAILAAQSGDHGLPPSMAPAPVHAAVASHYLDGGFFPRGGGFAIPRAFVRALKRAGGELRLRTGVERILLEGRRAVGVRLSDGTEIRAREVVSNADPQMTFSRLVGEENLGWGLRRRLSRTRYSVSALSLFMAADMDARGLGLDSGNYWSYRHDDLDAIYGQGLTATGLEGAEPPGMFLTVTTLKDPSKYQRGRHTMEAFAFVGYDAFRRWQDSAYGGRPEDYAAMKRDLTKRLLKAAGRIVPGLEGRLVFCDLGTPLTNRHFVAATAGNLYGTEKTLGQVGPWAFQSGTEIAGLSLCGASTVSHGVLGATISGLVAAAKLLGCRVDELLRQSGPPVRVYPSERPQQWPDELKARMARAPESAVA